MPVPEHRSNARDSPDIGFRTRSGLSLELREMTGRNVSHTGAHSGTAGAQQIADDIEKASVVLLLKESRRDCKTDLQNL